jgi:hypothetical protein
MVGDSGGGVKAGSGFKIEIAEWNSGKGLRLATAIQP